MAQLVELERSVFHSREVLEGAQVHPSSALGREHLWVHWPAGLPVCVLMLAAFWYASLPALLVLVAQRALKLRSPTILSTCSCAAAEAALAAQPDILINRIVAQFQRLFACRSLEGVLPAMNRLYLQHTGAGGRGVGTS